MRWMIAPLAGMLLCGPAWGWTLETGHTVAVSAVPTDVVVGAWDGRVAAVVTGPGGTFLVDPIRGSVLDRIRVGARRIQLGEPRIGDDPDVLLCGREGGARLRVTATGFGEPYRDPAACRAGPTDRVFDVDADGVPEILHVDGDVLYVRVEDGSAGYTLLLDRMASAYAVGDIDGDSCADLALVTGVERAVVFQRGVCGAGASGAAVVASAGDLSGLEGPGRTFDVDPTPDRPPWRPRACAVAGGLAMGASRPGPAWNRVGSDVLLSASPAWGVSCEAGPRAFRVVLGVDTSPLLSWETGGRRATWRLALQGGLAVGGDGAAGFVVGSAGLGLLAVGGGVQWLPFRSGDDARHGLRVQVDLVRASDPFVRGALSYVVRFGR